MNHESLSATLMGMVASQITSLTIVYSTVYSEADQRKHQSSASLAFVRGIHRGPVDSPHKWPVKGKMFPFDIIIMGWIGWWGSLLANGRLLQTNTQQAHLKCWMMGEVNQGSLGDSKLLCFQIILKSQICAPLWNFKDMKVHELSMVLLKAPVLCLSYQLQKRELHFSHVLLTSMNSIHYWHTVSFLSLAPV